MFLIMHLIKDFVRAPATTPDLFTPRPKWHAHPSCLNQPD